LPGRLGVTGEVVLDPLIRPAMGHRSEQTTHDHQARNLYAGCEE